MKVAQVSFELTTADGHFVCHGPDGSEIRVEAGKTFTTGDPQIIRELDGASHVIRRVKTSKEKED